MKTLLNSHNDKALKDLELEFAKRLNSLDISVINNYALTCDIRLLPFLASAYQVDIAGLSEHEARSLINDALSIHFRAGSVWAMKQLLKTFSEKAQLFEWFTYDAKPNHFKIKLLASANAADIYDKAKLDKYISLIEKIKNVHSVLDMLEIIMRDAICELVVSNAAINYLKLTNTLNVNKISLNEFNTLNEAVIYKNYSNTQTINKSSTNELNANTNEVAFLRFKNSFKIHKTSDFSIYKNSAASLVLIFEKEN